MATIPPTGPPEPEPEGERPEHQERAQAHLAAKQGGRDELTFHRVEADENRRRQKTLGAVEDNGAGHKQGGGDDGGAEIEDEIGERRDHAPERSRRQADEREREGDGGAEAAVDEGDGTEIARHPRFGLVEGAGRADPEMVAQDRVHMLLADQEEEQPAGEQHHLAERERRQPGGIAQAGHGAGGVAGGIGGLDRLHHLALDVEQGAEARAHLDQGAADFPAHPRPGVDHLGDPGAKDQRERDDEGERREQGKDRRKGRHHPHGPETVVDRRQDHRRDEGEGQRREEGFGEDRAATLAIMARMASGTLTLRRSFM
ncbi:MAG: hypothetical protein R3D80_01420 [Paracoccaceae bacterium]